MQLQLSVKTAGILSKTGSKQPLPESDSKSMGKTEIKSRFLDLQNLTLSENPASNLRTSESWTLVQRTSVPSQLILQPYGQTLQGRELLALMDLPGFDGMQSSTWISRTLLLSRELQVGQLSWDQLKNCSDPLPHSPTCPPWAGLAALEMCHVACTKHLQSLYIEINQVACKAWTA